MQIADFDTASMHHHQLFRDARTAMLVHRVLHQMERTAAAVDEVQKAAAEVIDAVSVEPGRSVRLPRAGWTLGL